MALFIQENILRQNQKKISVEHEANMSNSILFLIHSSDMIKRKSVISPSRNVALLHYTSRMIGCILPRREVKI